MKTLTLYIPGQPAIKYSESIKCVWDIQLATRVRVTINDGKTIKNTYYYNIPFIEEIE